MKAEQDQLTDVPYLRSQDFENHRRHFRAAIGDVLQIEMSSGEINSAAEIEVREATLKVASERLARRAVVKQTSLANSL
jgi:hypothetical protein